MQNEKAIITTARCRQVLSLWQIKALHNRSNC